MKNKQNSFFNPTNKHHKAMQWCMSNNINIYVKPTIKGLKVEVNNKKNLTASKEFYNNFEANNKVWELYLYIYKNNFKK